MKIRTVLASQVHAGDRIVIQDGTIRKSYPICEVKITQVVEITYKGKDGTFVHTTHGLRHRLKVRV
jgi:hypothetical protein